MDTALTYTHRNRRSPQWVVADDLTGACDAGVAFVSQGRCVRVLLQTAPGLDQDICCISTESRAWKPSQAEAVVTEYLQRLPQGACLFKKLDSVFRGNTIVELAAVVRSLPAGWVLCAPAYPMMGRTVRDGVLSVRSLQQMQTVDIAAALRHADVAFQAIDSASSLAEAHQAAHRSGARLLLCDAATQEDLQALVRAQAASHEATVWAGSAGLAKALAAESGTPNSSCASSALPAGRMLFCIGSDHAVMRHQLARLCASEEIEMYDAGCVLPDDDRSLVLRVGRDVDALRISVETMRVETLGSVFVTGGDTAARLCAALQAQSLRLIEEPEPGVPLAVIEGGRWSGVPLLLKSGGFGDADTLQRLYRRRERAEVHAV